MSKTEIVKRLNSLGFEVEELDGNAYAFEYEGLTMLYMYDEEDEEFFRIAAPRVFDVTEDNRDALLDMANEVNSRMKYSKTTVGKDAVWIGFELKLFGDVDGLIDDILEYSIAVISTTALTFYSMINGEDDGSDTEQGDDE